MISSSCKLHVDPPDKVNAGDSRDMHEMMNLKSVIYWWIKGSGVY